VSKVVPPSSDSFGSLRRRNGTPVLFTTAFNPPNVLPSPGSEWLEVAEVIGCTEDRVRAGAVVQTKTQRQPEAAVGGLCDIISHRAVRLELRGTGHLQIEPEDLPGRQAGRKTVRSLAVRADRRRAKLDIRRAVGDFHAPVESNRFSKFRKNASLSASISRILAEAGEDTHSTSNTPNTTLAIPFISNPLDLLPRPGTARTESR